MILKMKSIWILILICMMLETNIVIWTDVKLKNVVNKMSVLSEEKYEK